MVVVWEGEGEEAPSLRIPSRSFRQRLPSVGAGPQQLNQFRWEGRRLMQPGWPEGGRVGTKIL